jgi:hypothetical protein
MPLKLRMKTTAMLGALLLNATSALAPLYAVSRRAFVSASSAVVVTIVAGGSSSADAADDGKLRNLPNEKIAEMVRADVVEGQFLANGRLTRYSTLACIA